MLTALYVSGLFKIILYSSKYLHIVRPPFLCLGTWRNWRHCCLSNKQNCSYSEVIHPKPLNPILPFSKSWIRRCKRQRVSGFRQSSKQPYTYVWLDRQICPDLLAVRVARHTQSLLHLNNTAGNAKAKQLFRWPVRFRLK